MKISEMTNDQAAEALVRLSAPIGNICDDEDITKISTKYHEMEDIENVRALGRLLPELVAYALKKHKADFYEIIGILIGKTTEEVAKMSFAETLKAVKDSYDEVLRDFFISHAKPEKDTEN